MAIDIKLKNELREKIVSGVMTLNNAVKSTLGPKGRNVIISQTYGAPLIVNDGVTIAKTIELTDEFENLGAKSLAEASIKTNDLVGDGTTSAIILGASLIIDGASFIDKGVNPVVIRKGFNYYLPIIVEQIKKASTDIITNEDIYKVAYVSSGDEHVSKLIASAYEKIGYDGVITLEESQGIETNLTVVNGYSYDRGYLSSYMSNNDKLQAELENPYILIIDKKVSNINELVPFLEIAIKENRPILLICDELEQEVLSAIVVNKLRGIVNIVCTKAPGFAGKRANMLEDIALITKSTYVKNGYGINPSLENTILGSAKKVIVSNSETIIITDSNVDVSCKIKQLKNELLNTYSEYDKNQISSRISKLSGGIAIIKAGAKTELELREKKLLIEDAICATRAAISSGIIPGGGKVFYEISEELKKDIYNEYPISKELLINALKKPFYQLLENVGVSKETVIKQVNKKMWFDANIEKVVDYTTMNVIDPTNVAISVITNAISIAGVLLTTECGIVEKDIKKEVNEENLL